MGIAIPQVIAEDRASGAQVIDGSVLFDATNNPGFLERNFNVEGDRRHWILSCWVKLLNPSGGSPIFTTGGPSAATRGIIWLYSNELIFRSGDGSSEVLAKQHNSNRYFRNPDAWYNLTFCVNTNATNPEDRAKVWINGELTTEEEYWVTTYPNGEELNFGEADTHYITATISTAPPSANANAVRLCQYYYLDGIYPGYHPDITNDNVPELFGFRDPLTNTWRPKKYDGKYGYGTNGFYLPMDGNSPIGEDKSGQGNNWTPVNFGGSNTIEKATGALPILNTVSGGKVATLGVRTDAFANNLVLALPLVGVATDVSNQINSGTTEKVITAHGNAAPASGGQGMFYDTSFYLDGSADYVETSNSDDFVVGTGDFTIEAWYNVAATQTTNARLFAQNTNDDNNWDCYIDSSSGTNAIKINGGNTDLGMSFPSANTWHHFCIARKNGTLYSFMNGVLRHTQTYTNSVGVNNHGFRIGVIGGGGGSTGYGLNGYVQDFRFYNGVAKYTSDFIPASTNPDILPDTPSGVSGGSKLTKITEGAVAFDGNGDRLSIENNTDLTFGGGDFTMEAFVYIDSSSTGFNSLVSKYDGGSQPGAQGGRSWVWCLQNGIHQFYYHYNSGNDVISGTSSNRVNYNKWTHCAVAREGNTIRLFDDGQLVDTIDLTSIPAMNDGGTSPIAIGGDSVGTSTSDMDGYISNVRIVKGTALYTSNFTPPTEPLTNVTNTTLLCCQDITNTDNTWNTRMFISDSVHTDKADVLANGTEVFGGESITSKYIYIVPNSNDPSSNSDFIWSGNGALTHPSGSGNVFHVSKRVSGSWVHTYGSYGPDEYSSFYYGDDTGAYQLDKTHDFYGLSRNGDGDAGPGTFNGTLPYLSRYLSTPVSPSSVKTHGGVALTNFNPFSTDINTVRGQETGYCTFNVLRERTAGYNPSFSDGNLLMDGRGDGTGTLSASSGKFYYEVLIDTVTNNSQMYIGVQDAAYSGPERSWSTAQIAAIRDQGAFYGNGSTGTALGYAEGDLLSVAFDADDNKLYIAKNGIYMNGGNPSQGTGFTHSGINFAGGYTPLVSDSNVGQKFRANFGQKPFRFPPPDGFQPLNAANVRPETVITRPEQYVGIVTYTGNGWPNTTNPSQSISSLNFKPDLVWAKARTASYPHGIFDSVRGPLKQLRSNGSNTESVTTAGTDDASLISFDDRGFTLGPDGGAGSINYGSTDYVAWCWKAGDENVQYAADTFTDEVINKSENWSSTSDLTNPGNLFDNDIWNGATYFASSTENITTSSFTATKIRIRSNGGTSGQIFTVNGTGYAFNTGNNVGTWNEIDLGTSTTVTSLQVSGTGNFTLYAIEVDGKVLVDSTSSLVFPGLASTVRANSKAGFSIIQYNGGSDERSVSHGLSSAPKFVVAKKTNSPNADWAIYHNSLGSPTDTLDQTGRYYLKFNTDPQGIVDTYWDGKKPTDRVINLGTNISTNDPGGEYIMYAWHDVPGLQKFGSYLGNADNNGTFVELGFRPALLWIKRSSDGTNGWYVVDTEKSPINLANDYLYLNLSTDDSGFTNGAVDILSNGFKMRANTQATNNAATYIYAAWAESPAVNLYGGQSNAR